MMDPLKSVISIGNIDDTTLALPSENHFRSGQIRVLEQVKTVKRTKSRQNIKSGPTSPKSPLYDNVFTESLPATLNENAFFANGFHQTLSPDQSLYWRGTSTKGSNFQVNMARYNQLERRSMVPLSPVAVGKPNTSRSEPDFGQFPRPKRAIPSLGFSTNGRSTMVERSTSQYLTKGQSREHANGGVPSKTICRIVPRGPVQVPVNGAGQSKRNSHFVEVDRAQSHNIIVESAHNSKIYSGSNGNVVNPDITMKEAIGYLTCQDENYQHCGASFIQHSTFTGEKAKQEVLGLDGIPLLVNLLRSPSGRVQQTVSAALRNLSFKDDPSKEEIDRCGGITDALLLLRNTYCPETQKQLTGLLWNLSSLDHLKPELIKSAMPDLMEAVVMPYTTGPDRSSRNNVETDAFYNATGCLRNLSCAKQGNRQSMRKCPGLINSLSGYVQESVTADKPDDMSLENCVCILHNLTFQLENEAPALFSRINALTRQPTRAAAQGDTGPIGCFSQQNSKVLEQQENRFDYPVVEELNPKGAGWLIHSKTLQCYLSLLGSSQRDDTLEACCGALQNLTANQGIVSSVMSQAIVQKLNGLHHINPLLKSPKPNLQRNAVALVANLANNPNLQSSIARTTLPELMGILSQETKEGSESDDTQAMACQTAHSLLLKEPELGKRLLTNNLIKSLSTLSKNRYLPKSSKAAGALLYNLWTEKDIQSFIKKQGMSKSSFVNDITLAAYKSAQVIQ